MRILVVEDEPQLSAQISRALTRAGHAVEEKHDGPAGLTAAQGGAHDLIVLDVNLPKLDGFTILRTLRDARQQTRVLMLTARSELGDRLTGLKSGADDYLTKPFAMDELLARVEVLGRRTAQPNNVTLLTAADLRMDVVHRRVTRGGQAVVLSPASSSCCTSSWPSPGAPSAARKSAPASGNASTSTTPAPSRSSSCACAKSSTMAAPPRSSKRSAASATS